MTATESPLMRKIRLLMAKAQGTNNEHEAAAFAEKVQELLLENNLSVSDIKMSSGEQAESVGQHEQKNDGRDFLKSPARKALLGSVCRFYMCQYLRWGNNRVVIVGKKSNAEVATEMMNYLLETTIRLSNAYSPKQNERVDFRRGCMLALCGRLDELRYRREQEAKRPQKTGNTLPVLFVDESRQVEAYLKTQNVRVGKGVRVKQGLHASAGRQAGSTISLQPQVRQGAAVRRIGR